MIKVLHFIGSGKIGGQERAQYQLLKALKNEPGLKVAVAIGNNRGIYIEKIKELGIPIISLQIKSGFNLIFKKEIISKFKDYDIHHLHDPSPNTIIYSLLAGSKVKRVFTRRGGIFSYSGFNLKKILKFQIKKNLLRRFDGFSGNSLNAVDSIKKQYRIKGKFVHILYNGIDFSLLNPSIQNKYIRQKYGLRESDFLIGTACRLVRFKRIDFLVKAFSQVKIEHKKLVIFGKGVELKNLIKMSQDLGMPDFVIFAGEVENMPDHMQILDCFVLPSSSAESFGNAVVEAMYLKIPSIIMSDSEGLKEHITHMETGFIADDEADLARLIQYVESHRDESRRIAEAASLHVQEKYSIANMVRAYKEFYQVVLSEKR